jgi:hypothetical protein
VETELGNKEPESENIANDVYMADDVHNSQNVNSHEENDKGNGNQMTEESDVKSEAKLDSIGDGTEGGETEVKDGESRIEGKAVEDGPTRVEEGDPSSLATRKATNGFTENCEHERNPSAIVDRAGLKTTMNGDARPREAIDHDAKSPLTHMNGIDASGGHDGSDAEERTTLKLKLDDLDDDENEEYFDSPEDFTPLL